MASATKRQKTVKKEAGTAYSEGATLLLSDLANTLNRSETSDVTFVCKNGEKVCASRWLLSIRCPHFAAMFGYGMLESKALEIPLPQLSSSILLAVFKYLYTGESDPPLNWKMGFELMSAAHYFTILPIEAFAHKFLWSEMLKVDKDLQSDVVMAMLNKALEFHEAWEGKDELLLELTVNLRTRWFQGENSARKLSENAFNYILSKRKSHEKRECDEQSMVEYYSLRQAVLWQVYQKLPTPDAEAQQFLQKALPDWPSLSIMSLESWLESEEYDHCRHNRSDLHDPTALLNAKLNIDVQKESFQQLLDYIDWSRVPAILLLEVVHPLGLIPSSVLFKALAFHAVRRPVETWVHFPNIWKQSTGGLVSSIFEGRISSRHSYVFFGTGHAMASLPMREMAGTYQWQIEIQEREGWSICVGFVCGYEDRTWERSGLAADEKLRYCHGTRLLDIGTDLTHATKDSAKDKWDLFPMKLATASPIEFTLNASEKTCTANFGKGLTVSWKNLPDAVYYPVVGFDSCNTASVTIKVGRGFLHL